MNSSSEDVGTLKRTPLFQNHVQQKARMVDFGGWEMPVQYSGVVDEHKAVREAVGLFDVSHMGELNVEGRGAFEFLQAATSNDLSKLNIGQAQYSALLTPGGTLVDDIIIYRRGQDSFFICVNASNTEKDYSWLKSLLPKQGVRLENQSSDYAQIAVQGPLARNLVQEAVDIRIDNLKYYHFAEGKVFGAPAIIARTGYTGELGYELYVPAAKASSIWQGLLEVGVKHGVKPCGLGARDTLRLEMGFHLYGNDMGNDTDILSCGLGWITKLDKGDFTGRDALLKIKEAGLSNVLVGFEMVDKAIGRHGYPVFETQDSTEIVGKVTSGSPGPSVGKNIGMAYLPKRISALGSHFFVEIRGVRKQAQVVKRPFYALGTATK